MINPTQALIISSYCKNCDDQNINYRWRLYQTAKDNDGVIVSVPEEEITYLEKLMTTSVHSQYFGLKEDVLKPGLKYIIRVSAWRNESTEGMDQ